MSKQDTTTKTVQSVEPTVLRRGALLITALLAAVSGAAIYSFGLPALWRTSWPYALLFTLFGVVQLGTAVVILAHPTRRRVLLTAGVALAVLALWALERIAWVLPLRDPWIPVNSAIGFTDYLCAALEAIAGVGLIWVAVRRPQPHPSILRRGLAAVVLAPLVAFVLLAGAGGVYASSDGFSGSGFPAGTVPPQNLPAGKMSTVEYCRPDGVPLAMDLYMPPVTARTGKPAPVALYVHGGGVLGSRKTYGLSARLANPEGALFDRLRPHLNARGFVVASIDYRLPPGTPWPAQIEDSKCAVRFLRAHAADIGIDPNRIGAWGSSGGGGLVSLLALTGPEAGFDHGQYLGQSSAVQAVVDMFGPANINDMNDSSPFGRFILQLWFGSSSTSRRSASPITYVHAGAPRFLILQGTQDNMVVPRQSDELAQSLNRVGVPHTLIKVQGAGHGLTTPGQRPSPDELTNRVVDFFVSTLK